FAWLEALLDLDVLAVAKPDHDRARLDRAFVMDDEKRRFSVDRRERIARDDQRRRRRLSVDLRDDRLSRPEPLLAVVDLDAHGRAAGLEVDDVADVSDRS